MSEYQYYEFQAIDRPLTAKEMSELRSYSTRARITPTSFVNDYSFGSFKGNEDAWMEKYFDAYLYLANWGTHVLKLRLPSRLLDATMAKSYCGGDNAFGEPPAPSRRETPSCHRAQRLTSCGSSSCPAGTTTTWAWGEVAA